MKITVTVKANSKQEYVEELVPGEFRVRVKAPPIEGRANEAVIRVLAKHFGVPKSRIVIVTGASSKRKIIKIGTRD